MGEIPEDAVPLGFGRVIPDKASDEVGEVYDTDTAYVVVNVKGDIVRVNKHPGIKFKIMRRRSV